MFFCCLSCSANYNNQNKKNDTITKVCPVCNNKFVTKEGSKEATFCSRSCASKGAEQNLKLSPLRKGK